MVYLSDPTGVVGISPSPGAQAFDGSPSPTKLAWRSRADNAQAAVRMNAESKIHAVTLIMMIVVVIAQQGSDG
jgi:hypothetical protein